MIDDLSQEFHPFPKVYKEKKQPKRIRQIGKKGRANIEANKELKRTSYEQGKQDCEIKLPGCFKVWMGFAHGKKKRKLTPEELKRFAIRACNPCHDKIEYDCKKWTGMSMEEFVAKVLREREKHEEYK